MAAEIQSWRDDGRQHRRSGTITASTSCGRYRGSSSRRARRSPAWPAIAEVAVAAPRPGRRPEPRPSLDQRRPQVRLHRGRRAVGGHLRRTRRARRARPRRRAARPSGTSRAARSFAVGDRPGDDRGQQPRPGRRRARPRRCRGRSRREGGRVWLPPTAAAGGRAGGRPGGSAEAQPERGAPWLRVSVAALSLLVVIAALMTTWRWTPASSPDPDERATAARSHGEVGRRCAGRSSVRAIHPMRMMTLFDAVPTLVAGSPTGAERTLGRDGTRSAEEETWD